MTATAEIDAVRQEAILSSLAGFPFLLVYFVAWIAAAVLSYLVPSGVPPWVYLLGGVPAAPIARLSSGYVRAAGPDPLLPLTLQILFVQIVAIPAVMIVWSLAPNYVPVAFAPVVGGHFPTISVGLSDAHVRVSGRRCGWRFVSDRGAVR